MEQQVILKQQPPPDHMIHSKSHIHDLLHN